MGTDNETLDELRTKVAAEKERLLSIAQRFVELNSDAKFLRLPSIAYFTHLRDAMERYDETERRYWKAAVKAGILERDNGNV